MKGATFKFIREEFKDTLDALGKAIGNDGERIKPYDAATTAAHRLKELVEGGYITIVLHKVRKEDAVTCEAFALCSNPATLTIEHPILGTYESCERCEVKLNAQGGAQ